MSLWPVPGSCPPAASCGAPGSSRAEPERAISIGAARGGPPISTASLSPPGSAGSFKPMAAPIPPPAVTASCGFRASPGATAAGATSGSGQVVAGSRRRAHFWRMPFRSLQRLPPRSPVHRPAAARGAGLGTLAGRAGSRHRHPLPEMQDNKAEHPAETRAVCQLPEDSRTENPGGCLVLPCHATRSRGRPGCCPAPGHPGSCRICPRRPRTLELPRFPRLMCPGFPEPGCRILVMLRAGSGRLEVRLRSG